MFQDFNRRDGRHDRRLAGCRKGCRDRCQIYQNDRVCELIKDLLLVIWSEKEFGHQIAIFRSLDGVEIIWKRCFWTGSMPKHRKQHLTQLFTPKDGGTLQKCL